MRVLYISYSASWGGAETSLYLLVTSLSKLVHPIVLLPRVGPLAERLADQQVPCFWAPMPPWRQVRYWLKRYFALAYLARTTPPIDLIHGNTVWCAPYAHALAKKRGIPWIAHVRDLISPQQASKYHLDKADHVLAISQAVRQPLEAAGIRRVSVLYNGVDVDRFQAARPAALEGAGKVRVGILGQIVPGCRWKGYEEFLQAAALLGEEEAHFFIIGGDTRPPHVRDHNGYLETLKHLARELGLEKRVTFTGFRRDIPEVIAALDIVVNASWAEPFGRTIIEAMAAGKPVVGTRAGGIPEIIRPGETGLLVPPRDPEALAEALHQLIRSASLRLTMGQRAQERAQRMFSLRAQIPQIMNLYRRLVSHGGES